MRLTRTSTRVARNFEFLGQGSIGFKLTDSHSVFSLMYRGDKKKDGSATFFCFFDNSRKRSETCPILEKPLLNLELSVLNLLISLGVLRLVNRQLFPLRLGNLPMLCFMTEIFHRFLRRRPSMVAVNQYFGS